MMSRNVYKYPTLPQHVSNSNTNLIRAQRKSYNKSTVNDTTISTFQQKLIDTLNDYNHKYVMNSDQTRIQQSMPPVYTILPTGKPAMILHGCQF